MPFIIEEQQFVRKRGNRREVLDGIAFCTSGGLCAADLEERNGKIISKKRSAMGKKRYASKNPFQRVEDEKQTPEVPEVPEKKRKRKAATAVQKKPQPAQPEKLLRVPVARRRRGVGRRRR